MFDDRPMPAWAAAVLRRPVPVRVEHRDAIMALVRADAPRAARPRPRGARRTMLGLAVATALAGVAMGGSAIGLLVRHAMPEPVDVGAAIIGDSIAATLHDTLDLVRFALRAPRASRVVLAGDFNAWSESATPLVRDASGTWTAVVALHRGDRRFAFLVDDTRWVSAPAASPRAAARRAHGDST